MKHILVVDDNKVNLVSVKGVLDSLYKVTAVTSGEQALKFLERNHPDLILLDINMPEMDGFQVMEQIQKREEICEIPIIFLTADTDPQTESRCLEEGALDYIPKPFVPVVVRSRIARILELEDLRKSLANRLDEKIKEVSDMKNKSSKDALTGLWNRSYTQETVGAMLQPGTKGALFMMDMDNFKAINDNYGHQAGDETLQTFAKTLEKYATGNDVVCRIGGDEFMTFVAGYNAKTELCNHASNIISDMCYYIEQAKYETNSSVSVGIAQYPEDGEDFDALYNAADKALYYVKQNGKNSYHFFSDQSAMESKRRGNYVDLHNLRELMQRTDSTKGTYMVEYEQFHLIYNYARRIVERTNGEVQVILFTMDEQVQDGEEISQAAEMLQLAIQTSLRRVDVSTQYSGRQIIVILWDTNTENGSMVAEKIMSAYHKLYTGNAVFHHEVVKMEGKNSIPR